MTPKTRLRLLLGLNICAVLVVMAVHYSHTIHRIVPDPDALADKDTIAYCRIGERSSHTWFVLKELLGQDNVKNYDGSWTEYGSLVGVPVALGDEPGEA